MMKKILFFWLTVLALFVVTACNAEDEKPTTEEPTIEQPTVEEPTEETPIVVTQEMLEAVEFKDDYFEYDGGEHSIYATNVPKGVEVTYKNNGKTDPGSYLVQATITYGEWTVKKTAKIYITRLVGELTAEAEQTVLIYGGDVLPEYEINNTEQEVLYAVYKDDVEVGTDALYTPGVYTVKIYAYESKYYSEVETTVTLTVLESLFDLEYIDQTVEYDGEEHSLTLEDVSAIPNGYKVEYVNNKGSEVGSYYALALVKDKDGNVIETQAATLTIVYPDNAEFNAYLDDFFVAYLEEDQLSVNIFCENPEDFGLLHYQAEWYAYETVTADDVADGKEFFQKLIDELKVYEDAQLSPFQIINYNKIYDFLQYNLDLYDIEDVHLKQINYVDQFGGYVADFATYMEAYSLRSEVEIQDIIDYINSTPAAYSSYLLFVDEKAKAGYALSEYTITEMRTFLKEIIDLGADYYLADAINAKIDEVDFLEQDEKDYYKNQIETLMDTVYMNAVNDLYVGLESRLKLLVGPSGYWAVYKEGKELYLARLQNLLGLNNFDINQYIRDIEKQLATASALVSSTQSTIVKKYGIKTYDELEEVLARFPIFEGTPEEMMEYLKEFAPTIVPDLQTKPKIEIKEMDLASAKVSNAVAYYMKSALDNTGAEHITLNPVKLGDANNVLATLAHEGYPGHLYAYVKSKEIGQHNVSTIMTSTAHGEGWATYVELKLYDYAKANTTNKSLIEVIDYLYANQLMGFLLETRLDVGIHYEGWTVADCKIFLDDLGYNGDAAEEIYNLLIEMPAQYAAYGYGKLFFVNLHNEAQEILGAHYDEVEFNGMLLSKGWTSLGELENTYIEYMKAKCHQYGIEYNA